MPLAFMEVQRSTRKLLGEVTSRRRRHMLVKAALEDMHRDGNPFE